MAKKKRKSAPLQKGAPRAVKKAAARPRRKAARPKQPHQAPKYSKYEGKSRDEQMRIALFGPNYRSGDVETLVYEVTRGIQRGGTPFVFPKPEVIWLQHLKDAIRTGNADVLKRAAREATRAHLALNGQPFDSLALQLLTETSDQAYAPTVDEFLAKYFKHLTPNLDPWLNKKRQIRMLETMLGVRLST